MTAHRAEVAARFLMVAGVLILAATAPAAETFRKLSGPQARAKLAGMELTDDVHWREAYRRDGSSMSRSIGRARTGKWRIENDELCVELADQAESGCYEVWLAGTTVELRPTGRGASVQGVLQKPDDGASRR
jgi:hypothetical protein